MFRIFSNQDYFNSTFCFIKYVINNNEFQVVYKQLNRERNGRKKNIAFEI